MLILMPATEDPFRPITTTLDSFVETFLELCHHDDAVLWGVLFHDIMSADVSFLV